MFYVENCLGEPKSVSDRCFFRDQGLHYTESGFMRFSVDAHAIGQHLTGNETYVKNLLQGFAALDKTSEFIAYVSRTSAFREVPARFSKSLVAEDPFLRLGFDLPRKLRRDRPDLLHVQYTAPLFCPVPVVASVHDVSFLEHPAYFTRSRALQLRCTVRRTVRKAVLVFTASEFSKKSIVKAYGLDPDKVVVTPYAVSPSFHSISRPTAMRWATSRYGFAFPFILSVGDLQPRKNYGNLIKAFEELIAAFPQLCHHLVLVGKETWFSDSVRAAAAKSGLGDRIHFTGFVEDEDLLRLYGACDMFIYPSYYEGFGIPILEAMACGRAVACSNTSAMPEVADSAALLFDPYSVPEMVRAMRDLLLDSELRARMERLGAQRATLFTWEKTARQTLDAYYQVAGRQQRMPEPAGKSIFVGRS
jgi:glycosyltransferase involved in cell wall biosynthesis